MPFNSELQTERDCTREDVRAQARWEFERARGDTQLAADWCCRWGLSLLAAADAPDVSDELEEAEAEAK